MVHTVVSSLQSACAFLDFTAGSLSGLCFLARQTQSHVAYSVACSILSELVLGCRPP